MAEKGFGVKEVNLIGASGTPTISSPNNLNLDAINVAISTNATVGGTLTVSGAVSVGGTLTYEDVKNVDSIGIITARSGVDVDDFVSVGSNIHLGNAGVVTATSFVGDGSNLTGVTASGTGVVAQNSGSTVGTAGTFNFRNGLTATYSSGTATIDATGSTPSTSDIQVTYELTNQATNSYYRIAGNGVDSSANNPSLYLYRDTKYRFINNSGTTHPFRIQSDTASTLYSDGVTNNNANSGNIDFTPPHDAPSTLYYKCGNHGAMLGTINIVDFGGGSSSRGVVSGTSGSLAQNAVGNFNVTGHKSYLLMNVGLSTAGWFRLYTDSASRTADASRSVGEDPAAGSGVIAEVVTTGLSTSIKISPFVAGGNMDSTPSTTMYCAVKNLSSTTQAITANLTILKLED